MLRKDTITIGTHTKSCILLWHWTKVRAKYTSTAYKNSDGICNFLDIQYLLMCAPLKFLPRASLSTIRIALVNLQNNKLFHGVQTANPNFWGCQGQENPIREILVNEKRRGKANMVRILGRDATIILKVSIAELRC